MLSRGSDYEETVQHQHTGPSLHLLTLEMAVQRSDTNTRSATKDIWSSVHRLSPWAPQKLVKSGNANRFEASSADHQSQLYPKTLNPTIESISNFSETLSRT